MEITDLTEGMLSLTALSCGDKPLCDTRAGAGTVTATGTPCMPNVPGLHAHMPGNGL